METIQISNPTSFKEQLFFIIEGVRFKTLSAILVPVSMSGVWAFHQTGVFKADIFFLTLFSALFIQVAVNFFNDALDSKDFDISPLLRKGPSRPIQSGKVSFSQVRLLGVISCVIALILGVPLVLRGGWLIMFVGCLSCILAYLYTGGKLSLLKTGLSEFCAFLFFGPVAVVGTYYLQTLQFDMGLVYLGIQCGFWAVSILLINHLRDEEEDIARQRKHVVTVYGRTHSLFLLFVIQIFIYLLCFFWLGQNLKSGAFSFFVSPFSIALLYMISINPPSKKYNLYLVLCSLFYMIFGGVWVLGLLY